MEGALAEAQQCGSAAGARKILLDQYKLVCELTTLTQVVRGGYTLDSYTYIEDRLQKEEEKKNEETEAARKVLEQHLSDTYMPPSQALKANKTPPAPLQLSPPTLDVQPKAISRPKPANKPVTIPSRRPTRHSTRKESVKTFNPNITEWDNFEVPNYTQMRSGDRKMASSDAPTSEPKMQNQPIRKEKHKPTKTVLPKSSSKSIKAKAAVKAAIPYESQKMIKQKKPISLIELGKPKSEKRCHYCSEKTMYWTRCTYYQPTGQKCKNHFCNTCLVSKFSNLPVIRPKEWHGPCCLNICDCKTCKPYVSAKKSARLARRR